jgi:RNA polymerase sigma-70 factor (ECF subfamily)
MKHSDNGNCLNNNEPDTGTNVFNDLEVVQRIKQGDKEAFSLLVEKYKHKINAICYRMTLQAQESEDAAQEIFIKAYTKLPTFDERSAFFTWLYRVAANHCKNILRAKKSKKTSSIEPTGDSIPAKGPGPEVEREKRDISRIIEEKIGELKPNCRLIISLIHLEQHKYREAAEILRWSISKVKVTLMRCLERLRSKLGFLKEEGF